jgi:lysozyme
LAFRKGLTGAEALALLRRDAAVAVRAVKSAVRVSLAQHEFDALVSFAFNVGSTAFATSTLVKVLNQGARGAVPKELARWTNQGLPGLVRRRQAEGALFAHGRYS